MIPRAGTDFGSVVIVGAGVCGLATALRLLERRPGLDVTLLEAEREAGGLARSITLAGIPASLATATP